MISSYCIQIVKVKINLCIHTASSGSSLDCSYPFIYYIVSINFAMGQRSWSDWMMIKCWENDVISCYSLPKSKKEEKYHVYPKHSDTIPYLLKKFNKVIQLPVYLSEIARWETFCKDSKHSAFCSGSLGWLGEAKVSAVMYLMSLGSPTDFVLQMAKVCNPCSR